ncbi:putative holin-like toxin [Bacillus timonensis]|nr:putative holin-like toxin [Bacillus timonensis]
MPILTVFESIMMMISFASLIAVILTANQKK